MTTIQVRNVGTYGFDVTPLTGAGLSTADASSTRSQVQDALALADAIRQAMTEARDAGASSFKPTDSLLVLPGTMSATSRDTLFDTVIERAFSGGPLDLEDWSHAVDALEHWAGAQASMLPAYAGGGSRMVQGTWYVNGLPWSLSELFTVNRVNTLSEIDRLVADSLNVIAANNEAAKALTSLMEALFSRYYGMDDDDFVNKSMIEMDGQADADHPISYEQLLAYADKYIGPTSLIRKVGSLSVNDSAPYDATKNYFVGDFAAYDGVLYQANSTNTSTIASYSPSTEYAKWDTASYAGDLWQVFAFTTYDPDTGELLGIQGKTPGTTDDWRKVIDYDAAHKYIDKNEVVKYGGAYYQLIEYDKKPAFADNYTRGIDPTNTEFWKPYASAALRGDTPPSTHWDSYSEPGLPKDDFRAMIDEVETIINAFGSDNQVAQLRNETLFNSRSNLLEGLSAFLRGQQTTRSELARNA